MPAMDDDDFLERLKDEEEDLYRAYIRPVHPLANRIFLWLLVLSAIAIGVCLFLFFLTLFVYVFLPLVTVFLIWLSYKRWQWHREWRKIEKRYHRNSR